MTEFLVEVYLSRGTTPDASAARARRAADELRGEGTPVFYLSSIFVPEDETCFFLYRADTSEAVHEAARRASLTFERVSEAVASQPKGVER